MRVSYCHHVRIWQLHIYMPYNRAASYDCLQSSAQCSVASTPEKLKPCDLQIGHPNVEELTQTM